MMEKPEEKILKDVPAEKIIKEILPMLRNHMHVSQIFRSNQDYRTENPQMEFEEEYNNLSEKGETAAFYGFFSSGGSGEYYYLKVFFKGSLIIDIYAAKENQKVFLKEKIYCSKDSLSKSIIRDMEDILRHYK